MPEKNDKKSKLYCTQLFRGTLTDETVRHGKEESFAAVVFNALSMYTRNFVADGTVSCEGILRACWLGILYAKAKSDGWEQTNTFFQLFESL